MPSPTRLASATAWLERLSYSRHALSLLFFASVLETLLVPIPIETILIPWMLAQPRRKWRLASVALAGNLAAASIGYALGAWALNTWGTTLIPLFGGQDAYAAFQARMASDGFMAVLAVGIIPIPFQIAMLAAGSSGYPFPFFLLAALLARGARYFGLALLVHVAGDAALSLWRRHARPIGALGIALFGAWLWLQFMP
ncbi:VTT domain-containing protein [Chromohalobacter canadensis]|uniref:YqaA family protein n=1 Tax=Chromohalobacter canadensis TaxID=141389 RepID=UPI0021C11293|nr:VTT domain-containing protein [Chromohalobacter canadensis]MCT8467155.1 VTT domain-containing protein [Chromohalobacter canadensis]MCT8471097.1 VTT domain-containing protein [Chromohalobacter canadensis]MCT8497652.1 VTT domain-containing protein [Chromohalobacter canadensis]